MVWVCEFVNEVFLGDCSGQGFGLDILFFFRFGFRFGGRISLWITLPETNTAPENGWLEDDISFWGNLGLFFRCELLVSGRGDLF